MSSNDEQSHDFWRYSGSTWETRFLPRLSTSEIDDLPKQDTLVVQPIGAVEQHGPHLPVYTDTLIGEVILTRTLEQLPDSAPIWVLPPLAYGKSNEHRGRAGTISLSADTLQSVLMDVGTSIAETGFPRLLLWNSHGGNGSLIRMMSREIRLQTELSVFTLSWFELDFPRDFLNEAEQNMGIHAGEVETSLMLAMKQAWVQRDRFRKEYPDLPESSRFLTLSSRRFAWVMDDLSESGICGDARNASAEKGRKIINAVTTELAEALQEMVDFDVDELRS